MHMTISKHSTFISHNNINIAKTDEANDDGRMTIISQWITFQMFYYNH
jgi:hypothetical protein